MSKLDDEIEKLEQRKNSIQFAYLARLCQEHFGRERINGSHHIFKTPWQGDPRINLQRVRGKAKPYQVEQVISALERLREMEEIKSQQPRSVGKGDANVGE
ncbi:MAG TPA: hypothetical protein VKB02_01785 [Pyrinomonadaceae bacterium]|nr:hypothetical protein [Pyrinomonadaceae bacterium]